VGNLIDFFKSMPSQDIPRQEIPKSDRKRYQPLVDYFIPAVRLKPLDLWVNFRAHHRIAIPKPRYRAPHTERIKLAIYYIWDAPTKKRLAYMRPGWSSFTIDHWLERFERHERRWGPGDIELVTMILERQPGGTDMDSLDPMRFGIDEICYRTGAHVQGVMKQAWAGNWDKLGNTRVRYKVTEAPFEMLDGRPVLTVDSYHHSFYEPGCVSARALKWSSVIIPRSKYFPEKSWEYFKIVEHGRGCEPWHVT
jgi:hypothetical protein